MHLKSHTHSRTPKTNTKHSSSLHSKKSQTPPLISGAARRYHMRQIQSGYLHLEASHRSRVALSHVGVVVQGQRAKRRGLGATEVPLQQT